MYKKKNYSGEVTNVILESMLTDVKDLFKENYNQYKLMHMIIDKYIIDGVSYSSLQDQISNDEICLEIKFISIPNLLTLEIEKIFQKNRVFLWILRLFEFHSYSYHFSNHKPFEKYLIVYLRKSLLHILCLKNY